MDCNQQSKDSPNPQTIGQVHGTDAKRQTDCPSLVSALGDLTSAVSASLTLSKETDVTLLTDQDGRGFRTDKTTLPPLSTSARNSGRGLDGSTPQTALVSRRYRSSVCLFHCLVPWAIPPGRSQWKNIITSSTSSTPSVHLPPDIICSRNILVYTVYRWLDSYDCVHCINTCPWSHPLSFQIEHAYSKQAELIVLSCVIESR